jgi:RNA polymerase sigma-70 factor (ECF subfamily)
VDEAEARDVMAGIAAGQEAALARLIAGFGPALTRFAARTLSSQAEAEEAAQDCFVRVWRQARAYDPARGSVAAWLYKITTNLCIDRQRRARLRRFFGAARAEDMEDLLPDPGPGTEAALADRQRLAQVRRALAGLPERQRMALLLAAVAGLETREIAVIMAASQGSVEQLLVRARRSLRETLGESDAG